MSARRSPDARHFVEISTSPSVGVETTTGRTWVGIDQQVGHGSADALFAVTDEQYPSALGSIFELGDFVGECWRGEHPDLLLFHPGGGAWAPENWSPSRTRMLPPRLIGEIWRHVDALGTADGDTPLSIAQDLARGALGVDHGRHGVSGLTIDLTGDAAYPRPAGLVRGLAAGSTRDAVAAVLGAPTEAASDLHRIEGDLLECRYRDGGLAGFVLRRPSPAPLPIGPLRSFLDVIGTPEYGPEFHAVTGLAGVSHRRWAASTGLTRRLLVFDGGLELQVENDCVLSARLRLRAGTGPVYAGELFPSSSPTRDDVHDALGSPVAVQGGTDLHRFDGRDLLIDYTVTASGPAPSELTAVRTGRSVSHGFHRWRSGEFTMFLDVLGLDARRPLAEHVRALPGVRLREARGVVDAVEIGAAGYREERFSAFVDGMPERPARTDIGLGAAARVSERHDLRDLGQGWMLVSTTADDLIHTIVLSRDEPPESAYRVRGRR